MAYVPDDVYTTAARGATFGARYLYGYLCKLADEDGICWPRLETIAADIGCHRSQAVRWRKELVALGWIRLEKNGRRTTYQLLFGTPRRMVRNSHPKGAELSPLKGDVTAPLARSNGAESSPRKVTKQHLERCENVTAHIRTEPAHEPAHEPELLSVSNSLEGHTSETKSTSLTLGAFRAAKRREPNKRFEVFAQAFSERFSIAYRHSTADFVQLARLERSVALDGDYWRRAVSNYFGSPMGKYTLADLSSRVEVFACGRLNRYNKPVDAITQTNRISMERFIAGGSNGAF